MCQVAHTAATVSSDVREGPKHYWRDGHRGSARDGLAVLYGYGVAIAHRGRDEVRQCSVGSKSIGVLRRMPDLAKRARHPLWH